MGNPLIDKYLPNQNSTTTQEPEPQEQQSSNPLIQKYVIPQTKISNNNPLTKYLPKVDTGVTSYYKSMGMGDIEATKASTIESPLDVTKMLGDEEFQNMSGFGKTLDILGRIGSANKAGLVFQLDAADKQLKQAVAEGRLTQEESQDRMSPKRSQELLKIKPEIKKNMRAWWRGLSGQERHSMNEIWSSMGVEGVPFLGFMSEIAMDPMAWKQVGGKVFGVAAKGIGAITKPVGVALQKVKPIGIATGYVLEKTGQAKEVLQELFINKSKIPELAAKVDEWLSRRSYMTGQEMRYGINVRDRILKISKASKLKVDEVEKQVVNYIEDPRGYAKTVHPGSKALAKEIKGHLDGLLSTETKVGVPISALGQARKVRIVKLYDDLETAIGTEKTRLLTELNAQKEALGNEVATLRNKIQQPGIKVVHWSEKEIRKWKIDKEHVSSDLGTDFGTETAARARAADIGGGKPGVYHEVYINPKKSLELGKVDYWDNPEEVLNAISKSGKLSEDVIADLAAKIPDPKSGTFKGPTLKFNRSYFYGKQNQWYDDVRSLLKKEGYDSIKYTALEDQGAITWKIIDDSIISKVKKVGAKDLAKINSAELEVNEVINKTANLNSMVVDKKTVVDVANKMGVGIKEANELAKLQKARDLGYFPRVTTKEATKFLKNARVGGSKVWTTKMGNALKRKTSDFTLEEWNAFVTEHGLESLGSNKIGEYFSTEPAYALAVRGIRSAKAVTSAGFFNDVGNIFGKASKEAPEGWHAASDALLKVAPRLKGLKFAPEVLEEINRVHIAYINPKIGPIKGIYDMAQGTWKRWMLAVFPKYHLRNMVGNMWNNYLADIKPINYPKAQALQMYGKYKGTGGMMEKLSVKEMSKFGINTDVADEILKNAQELGVLKHGFYGADVEIGLRQGIIKGKSPIDIGMATGTTVENNARLAHFMSKLDDGKTGVDAATSVKKFLFDYDDLTDFEKQVMKRTFPFYTWTRKNIPLQLEQMIQQPHKFVQVSKVFAGRDEQDLLRLKYTKPELYERLPIEIRRDVDSVTYIPLEGLIPAGDLSKMFRPQQMIFELLSPFIRVPVELYMNRSLYFGSDIQRYDNETQQLLGLDLPVKLKYLLTSVTPQARLLTEMDKLIRKDEKEYTAGETALAGTLSTIYKMDLKQLRNRALSNMKRRIEDLKKGAAWAKKNGRENEYAKIKDTYEDIKEEVDRLR